VVTIIILWTYRFEQRQQKELQTKKASRVKWLNQEIVKRLRNMIMVTENAALFVFEVCF